METRIPDRPMLLLFYVGSGRMRFASGYLFLSLFSLFSLVDIVIDARNRDNNTHHITPLKS
jgi:hypothetical protein